MAVISSIDVYIEGTVPLFVLVRLGVVCSQFDDKESYFALVMRARRFSRIEAQCFTRASLTAALCASFFFRADIIAFTAFVWASVAMIVFGCSFLF